MVKHADLIGVPFKYGARGPDAYDCYGLVMEMTRRSGRLTPDFGETIDWNHALEQSQGLAAAAVAVAVPQWEEISCQAGAVVLFRIGRLVSHCGFMLDEDRMIHAWDKSGGVTVERIDAWKQRIVGFYRYVGSSHS